MKCNISDCALCNDCGILDITKKIPINKHKCSYYRNIKQQVKKEEFSEESKNPI